MARERTEVMVIDRDYCHRVERSWMPLTGGRGGRLALHVSVGQARDEAAALCETLNEWALAVA